MNVESYKAMAKQATQAIQAGNQALALALLDQLATRFPHKAAIHALRADAIKSFGDFAKAHDEARMAVGLDPNCIAGYQVLADAAWDLGHKLEAQQAYEKITQLELDPEVLALAWIKYAMFMAYERGPRVAEKIALKAVDIAPKNPDAWAALGLAQFRDHRPDEAVASLNKALSLDPHSLHSEWILATIYKWIGEDAKAHALARLMQDEPAGKPLAAEIHEHIRRKHYNQGITPETRK